MTLTSPAPFDPSSSPARRLRVAIVGAGAAGAFTAYRLRMMYGDAFELELFERSDRVGGNAWSQTIEFGGQQYNIDCGAQFFYRNPQPSYVQLLEDLGLVDDGLVTQEGTGFCVWDQAQGQRRLWIPAMARRLFAYEDPDWDRLGEFIKFLLAAMRLDSRLPIPWDLSLQDWLDSLTEIDADFRERVIKPFMYQFVSLPLARIGEASAVYAITYFVRNVTGQPDDEEPEPRLPSAGGVPLFRTYQSLIGLDGVHLRALDAVSVVPRLRTGVTALRRVSEGKLELTLEGGQRECFDKVVLACDPGTSAAILAAGGTADRRLLELLGGLEYAPLALSIQQPGACHMPQAFRYWEPVNTLIDGDKLRFTAWFGPLRREYFDSPAGHSGRWAEIPVFKSWGAPDVDPPACEYDWRPHLHRVVMPTTTFLARREALMHEFQGRDQVWFVGGWTNWFDSQEAALDSATLAAEAMTGLRAHPGTGAADTIIRYRRDDAERRLERWVHQVSRSAPRSRRYHLHAPLDDC